MVEHYPLCGKNSGDTFRASLTAKPFQYLLESRGEFSTRRVLDALDEIVEEERLVPGGNMVDTWKD